MKLRIKPGTLVWQDYRLFCWRKELADVDFEVDHVAMYGVVVRADGFGHLKSRGDTGDYGSGAVTILHNQLGARRPRA